MYSICIGAVVSLLEDADAVAFTSSHPILLRIRVSNKALRFRIDSRERVTRAVCPALEELLVPFAGPVCRLPLVRASFSSYTSLDCRVFSAAVTLAFDLRTGRTVIVARTAQNSFDVLYQIRPGSRTWRAASTAGVMFHTSSCCVKDGEIDLDARPLLCMLLQKAHELHHPLS